MTPRLAAITQTILEHTFNQHGECVCGWVGHGPRTAARHVGEQIEAALGQVPA